MAFTIQHNKDTQQFFTVIDGKTSVLKYSASEDGKTLNYYSTFVPPELHGRRIGDALVIFALNYAKQITIKSFLLVHSSKNY